MSTEFIIGAVLLTVGCTGLGLLIGYVMGVVNGRTEAAAQWRDVQANLIRDTTPPEGA